MLSCTLACCSILLLPSMAQSFLDARCQVFSSDGAVLHQLAVSRGSSPCRPSGMLCAARIRRIPDTGRPCRGQARVPCTLSAYFTSCTLDRATRHSLLDQQAWEHVLPILPLLITRPRCTQLPYAPQRDLPPQYQLIHHLLTWLGNKAGCAAWSRRC